MPVTPRRSTKRSTPIPKGLPRDTAKVCDEVLRDLLVKNKKQATVAEVEHIAKELNLRV